MGLAVTEMNIETGKVKVVFNTKMQNTITQLTSGMAAQAQAFREELDSYVRKYNPAGLIAERFQARGLMGTTSECVTLMMGIVYERYGFPIKFITAATWKNDFNQRIAHTGKDLKDLYKWTKVEPHQLDAALISIYGLEVGARTPAVYKLKKLILGIEDTSAIRLINRKTRK